MAKMSGGGEGVAVDSTKGLPEPEAKTPTEKPVEGRKWSREGVGKVRWGAVGMRDAPNR